MASRPKTSALSLKQTNPHQLYLEYLRKADVVHKIQPKEAIKIFNDILGDYINGTIDLKTFGFLVANLYFIDSDTWNLALYNSQVDTLMIQAAEINDYEDTKDQEPLLKKLKEYYEKEVKIIKDRY